MGDTGRLLQTLGGMRPGLLRSDAAPAAFKGLEARGAAPWPSSALPGRGRGGRGIQPEDLEEGVVALLVEGARGAVGLGHRALQPVVDVGEASEEGLGPAFLTLRDALETAREPVVFEEVPGVEVAPDVVSDPVEDDARWGATTSTRQPRAAERGERCRSPPLGGGLGREATRDSPSPPSASRASRRRGPGPRGSRAGGERQRGSGQWGCSGLSFGRKTWNGSQGAWFRR